LQDFAESISSSLFYASEKGNTDVMKLLLDEKADVNATVQVSPEIAGQRF
jgi:hypothetical protein